MKRVLTNEGQGKPFIPFAGKQKLSKVEADEKAVQDEIEHRRAYVLYFEEMEKKKDALNFKKALIIKYRKLYLELEHEIATEVLPANAFAAEIAELTYFICKNSLDMHVRTLLMHVLCAIYNRQIDHYTADFVYPTAPKFLYDLKTFLLYWGGMSGTEEPPLTHDLWKNLLQRYALISLAVADGKQWTINDDCGRFLYVQERIQPPEDLIQETAQLIHLMDDMTVSSNNNASVKTLTVLQSKIKEQREWSERKKREAMKVVIEKELEIHYDVTFSRESTYPWFTKVFCDMTHSIYIINQLRSSNSPWKRITVADFEPSLAQRFITGMNRFIALFLKEFHQKDLLNELQELKFFNRAFVPGITESSHNYANEVNLEIWRNMYPTEVTCLNEVLGKEDLNLVTFWCSLKSGVLFDQWFRFFIIRLVLQIALYKFIPSFAFDVLDVRYVEELSNQSRDTDHFFIHNHYWGFLPFKIFAFGFDAPFLMLLKVLMVKDADRHDPFITYFIQSILRLADHPHERFPDYPTVGSVAAAQTVLPPNIIFFQEKQGNQRIFK